MFNKSIDLIKGSSADRCMYVYVYMYVHTNSKLLFDCDQFVTGSLKNFPSALYLCTWFGEEGGTESLLGPLDPGSQNHPDGTHSPKVLAGTLATIPMQGLMHLPGSVARVMGTFLSGQRPGTQLFPGLLGRAGLSWPGSDGDPESGNISLKKML